MRGVAGRGFVDQFLRGRRWSMASRAAKSREIMRKYENAHGSVDQNKPKKNAQHCANPCSFTAFEHLMRLKTGRNWRFKIWKCAAGGYARTSNVFMHVYEGADGF